MAVLEFLAGREILDSLKKRGINIPDKVTRIVIDIDMKQIVKLYYSCLAEAAHIDVFKQVITNTEINLEVNGVTGEKQV